MSRRRLAIGVVVIAALLLGGRALSILYDSFTWYDALGARTLWVRRAVDAALVYGSGVLIAFAFAFVNFVAVRRAIGRVTRPRRLANVEFGEAVPLSQLNIAGATVSAAVAIGLAGLLPPWQTVALARLGVDFGEADPYLHHDLSFYVTWLPLERVLYTWTITLVVVTSVLVVASYVLSAAIRWSGGVLLMTSRARQHLGILTALLLLVCTWSYRLDSYDLLSGASHDGAGFGYVDHRWMLSGFLALSLITAATALTVAVSAWMGQLRTSLISIIVAIGMAGLIKEVLPFAYYRTITPAEAATREEPYAATRADFTRRAFGADVEGGPEGSSPFAALPAVSSAEPAKQDSLISPGAMGTRIVDNPTLDIAAPSLGTGLPRIAHAWATRDFGLLSDSIRHRARIVSVRDVRERISRLYPFFYVGRTLRPLLRADTLFWSAPLYTTSADYPLAEHREISGETRSYFHRSGTALVNARTGRVFAAIDLPPEPVAAGWLKNFESSAALARAQAVQHSLSMSTAASGGVVPGESDTTFRARVIRLYDRMRIALSAGDLREFGLAYDSLGALVGSTRK